MTKRASKLSGRTVSEIISDPGHQRKVVAWQRRSEEARREYQEIASELLTELRSAGYAVQSVGELRHGGTPYRTALPILARWLPRIHDPRVKDDIVRTMSVKGAEPYLGLLVDEFDKAGPGSLRWAIGNALEILASDAILGDMVRIATDGRFGRDREMVVFGLRKLKVVSSLEALRRLLHDEDVAGFAARALGNRRAIEALPDLRALSATAGRDLKRLVDAAIAKIEKKPPCAR